MSKHPEQATYEELIDIVNKHQKDFSLATMVGILEMVKQELVMENYDDDGEEDDEPPVKISKFN